MFYAGGMFRGQSALFWTQSLPDEGGFRAKLPFVRGGERDVGGVKALLRFLTFHYPLPNLVDGLGY
jgi:hypothetical protein